MKKIKFCLWLNRPKIICHDLHTSLLKSMRHSQVIVWKNQIEWTIVMQAKQWTAQYVTSLTAEHSTTYQIVWSTLLQIKHHQWNFTPICKTYAALMFSEHNCWFYYLISLSVDHKNFAIISPFYIKHNIIFCYYWWKRYLPLKVHSWSILFPNLSLS